MRMSARAKQPEHYLFEDLVYVVKGRGATSVWQSDGRKQTFEWHEGSMFSPIAAQGALTRHYGLTAKEAVYFSLHEEADTREHEDGIMGHGSFRRMVLQRLLEDGAEVRPGYGLEYCALTAIDLHGGILQAAVNAAERE